MKPERLVKLRDATALDFLRAQQQIQPILAEETQLRQKLAQIRQQDADNRDASLAQSVQATGADLAWRAWVSKTQRELNIELARVLVRKLPAMDAVRQAFGRKEAVRQIVEKSLVQTRKDANRRASFSP